MSTPTRSGYAAYARYQWIGQVTGQFYRELGAPIWADLQHAAIRLSLTEASAFPDGRAGRVALSEAEDARLQADLLRAGLIPSIEAKI